MPRIKYTVEQIISKLREAIEGCDRPSREPVWPLWDRRVTVLLHQEGWSVNHKRVERMWRQEGLSPIEPSI